MYLEEKELTDYMLHKVATDVYRNWDRDTIIDELVWLYDRLSRHDEDLRVVLIENAEQLPDIDNI